MKKLFMILLGSIAMIQASSSQAQEVMYRPYVNCASADHSIQLSIKQNVVKSTPAQFVLSVLKMEGEKIADTKEDLAIYSVPSRNKEIGEWFQGSLEKPIYEFDLMITTEHTELGYVASFIENETSHLVYCSHLVTFGN